MAGNGENKGWPKHNRFIPDGRFIKICLSSRCRKIYPKHCKACMYCGYLGFGIRAVQADEPTNNYDGLEGAKTLAREDKEVTDYEAAVRAAHYALNDFKHLLFLRYMNNRNDDPLV